MNWKELYALVNENIKNAVSGLYKPAGDVTFAELPELSQSVLGYTYTVTNAFTTDSRFTDYDTETQAGHSFPADTEVAVIVTGTTENPVYMFNVMGGIMDGYATKGDLNNYVEKEAGKSLSTNDYTDADKALVQDSPITVTATGTEITASTAQGNLNALTVYGKSEIVDSAIVSAGEGYAVVDLGTLAWRKYTGFDNTFVANLPNNALYITGGQLYNVVCAKYNCVKKDWNTLANNEMCAGQPVITTNVSAIAIKDTNYTDPTAFTTAMSGVLLCCPLADPTQGNTIAVKNDNGSGINGTMATFTTGTPLRGIPDTTVRDVMAWYGSSGEVTKNCGAIRLADLNIIYDTTTLSTPIFAVQSVPNRKAGSPNILLANYLTREGSRYTIENNMEIASWNLTDSTAIAIRNDSYTNVSDFVASLGDAELVYELATPTTASLTSTENASIAGLRTFEPQTHAQNNAGATMTVEAYAGTENGKAVQELKQDVQSEIATQTAAQFAMIAAPYDSTATYNVGDYVTEGGKLYKCSTPVSTAEPFDPTKWTATTVMAEIA